MGVSNGGMKTRDRRSSKISDLQSDLVGQAVSPVSLPEEQMLPRGADGLAVCPAPEALSSSQADGSSTEP